MLFLQIVYPHTSSDSSVLVDTLVRPSLMSNLRWKLGVPRSALVPGYTRVAARSTKGSLLQCGGSVEPISHAASRGKSVQDVWRLRLHLPHEYLSTLDCCQVFLLFLKWGIEKDLNCRLGKSQARAASLPGTSLAVPQVATRSRLRRRL